jgi:uncharacterized membrane protein YgcG
VVGKVPALSRRKRKKVDQAVQAAEQLTGLQFCVYLGPGSSDPRQHAESMFVTAGLHERPAVLILVEVDRHKVEIVTAPAVKERIPDDVCARAIEEMAPLFAAKRFDQALVSGLQRLASHAGPGEATGGDLPNIVGD